MLRLYASSPDAQPATHTRMVPSSPLFWTRRGTISSRRNSQIGSSRKNDVTLIRMQLNSAVNSSGATCSRARYDENESAWTCSIRFSMRRVTVERLYPVKSNPRLSRRYSSSVSRSWSVAVATFSHHLLNGSGDVHQREHHVHVARLDGRPRHTEDLRRSLILRDHDASSRLDRADAGGAIDATARQHDPYGAAGAYRRHRREQHVYRRPDEVDARFS